MDVTSLLNSASAANRRESTDPSDQVHTPSAVDGTTACSSAVHTPSSEKAESRRTSDSKTPIRNRTPWDAGGYSLPLLVDTKANALSAKPAFYSESPLDSGSPKSPKHKFSDSHSSLSSYTSSSVSNVQSSVHSRMSSMSTVGGFQSMSSLITDLPFGERRPSDALDSAVSRSSAGEYPKRPRKEGVTSPTTIAEEPLITVLERHGSPSDAMLISRGAQSSESVSPRDATNPRDLRPNLSLLVPPDNSKAHKRASSAPDYVALNAIDPAFSAFPPSALDTVSPLSQPGEARPNFAMEPQSAVTDAPVSVSAEEGIKCMYVDNCDTGSQPRKAISHIFGRNKLCTRMIPQHVWVHFCRKHYQRSRYRNAQEYAKLQCELVQKQIQRVHAWSEENKRSGQAGVVEHWTLSVRKREQKRLDDRTSKKRPFRQESEEDDDIHERAILNGTAVPDWMLEKCGPSYSTPEIEEIVGRLKAEMDQGILHQIPDIEILPSITTDSSEDGKNGKVVPRRKSSTGSSHKRSQSVGYGFRSESSLPMVRRTSQPSFWASAESSPIDKRQRVEDFAPYRDRQGLGLMPQVVDRGYAMRRPTYHLTHRPALNNVRENQTEECYFEEADGRVSAAYGFTRPLPAPTPQRVGAQTMAAQLDTVSQGYVDVRRPTHQRSVSEMGSFHQNQGFAFRAPGPAEFSPAQQGYPIDAMGYETAYMRAEPSFAGNGPPGYYDDPANQRSFGPQPTVWAPAMPAASQYGGSRHMRHQSTPIVPNGMPRESPTNADMRPSFIRSGPFDEYPQRQLQSLPTRHGGYRSMVEETGHAKAMYAERR